MGVDQPNRPFLSFAARLSRRGFLGGMALLAAGLASVFTNQLPALAATNCRPITGACAFTTITCVAGTSYGGVNCDLTCCDPNTVPGCLQPYQVCCDEGIFFEECQDCDCSTAIDVNPPPCC